MEGVQLKRKVTLRRKEEPAVFTFSGLLKIKLLWQSSTDLDLCLFFKKKDGEIGGVFSSAFRQKKSDLGSLTEFPFMLHKGDEPEPAIQSDSGDYFEVVIDAVEQGHVYHVCSIKNANEENSVLNEGVVMDLGTAFDKIPGFSLICE